MPRATNPSTAATKKTAPPAKKSATAAQKSSPAAKKTASATRKSAPVAKKSAPAASTTSAKARKSSPPAPTKKAPVKQAASSSAPAKKAPAKAVATKTVAKKAPAKAVATKAPAKKAPAAKKAAPAAPAKKAAPAAKAPAKKATAPAAKPKPAVRKLSAADKKFIEVQRLTLIDERATYLRQADTLKAEADSLAELREPGDVQFDEESGEGDTLAVERERDLALSHQARAAVEEIDHALAKVELGTYGICEVSGQPIPRERLKAIPWARERVEYKVGGFGRR